MDSWSPDQLRKMQMGGNNKLNTFLKSYGIDKHEDIAVKYNTEAARVSKCCGACRLQREAAVNELTVPFLSLPSVCPVLPRDAQGRGGGPPLYPSTPLSSCPPHTVQVCSL